MMDLQKAIEIYAGGQGSGCRGSNCGRKGSGASKTKKGAGKVAQPLNITSPKQAFNWLKKNGKVAPEPQMAKKALAVAKAMEHEAKRGKQWDEDPEVVRSGFRESKRVQKLAQAFKQGNILDANWHHYNFDEENFPDEAGKLGSLVDKMNSKYPTHSKVVDTLRDNWD